jgi:hypothetical protein
MDYDPPPMIIASTWSGCSFIVNHFALDPIVVETFEANSPLFSGALAPLPGFYLIGPEY